MIEFDNAQDKDFHRSFYPTYSLAVFSKPARLNNCRTAWSTCLKFTSRMGLRAMNIRSQPSLMSPWRSLVASRMRRLARLRTTALPTQWLAEKPKRLCSKSLGKAHRTNKGWAQERPSRRTCWNCLLLLKRYLVFNPQLLATSCTSARPISFFP